MILDDTEVKEETNEDDSYFDGEGDMMDTEILEEDGASGGDNKTPDYAIANVSCQYDGSPGEWWFLYSSCFFLVNYYYFFLDENGPQNNTEVKMPMFVANISGGQYDGSPGK